MSVKYQAYDEYKDSGVEWLGKVPNNWTVSKLGYLINTIVPMRDKPTSLKGNVPWIRIEDFDGKYISDSKSGQGVSDTLIKDMHLKVFPVGTVFVLETVPKSNHFRSCMIVEKKVARILYKCRGEVSVWTESMMLQTNVNKVTLPDDSEYSRWRTHHTEVIWTEYLRTKIQ